MHLPEKVHVKRCRIVRLQEMKGHKQYGNKLFPGFPFQFTFCYSSPIPGKIFRKNHVAKKLLLLVGGDYPMSDSSLNI